MRAIRYCQCAADTFHAAVADSWKCGQSEPMWISFVTVREQIPAPWFDGIKSPKAATPMFLIIDTAGRLQNKNNLAAELGKIKRVF